MKKKLLIFALLICSLLVLSACKKTIYICANGNAVDIKEDCPYNKITKISQKDAEKFGTNYVGAYVQALEGKAKLVSSFNEKGDYFATFIITPDEGIAYETVVQIDGITGKVNCTEGCQYS